MKIDESLYEVPGSTDGLLPDIQTPGVPLVRCALNGSSVFSLGDIPLPVIVGCAWITINP